MTVRVQRIGDQLGILLSDKEIHELCLREDDVLEIEAFDGRIELKPFASLGGHLESYRRTRDEHAGVYTELAK
jgi:hypothetical protein